MEKEIYKSDSSEMQNRINECYLLILQGYQRKFLIQYFTEKYNIGERQIDNYIKTAREEMCKDSELSKDIKKNEILAQYYNLYQKNYDFEDYRACESVLQKIANIIGVEESRKLDITSKGEKINTPQTLEVTIVKPVDE